MKFNLERHLHLPKLLKELANGLRKLTFRDNFQVTIANVTIEAGQEIGVNHSLNSIPKWYIIGRQSGPGQIVDGNSEWTTSTIFLQNTGTDTVNIDLIIFK